MENQSSTYTQTVLGKTRILLFIGVLFVSALLGNLIVGLSREWDAMRELIEGDMQLLEKTFRYVQPSLILPIPFRKITI